MDDIKLAETLSDHNHRIGWLEERMGKAENLIEEIRNLSGSVQLLAQESKNTGEKIDDLTQKVDRLEAVPAKKWGTVQTVALTAAITAIVTAVITEIINFL